VAVEGEPGLVADAKLVPEIVLEKTNKYSEKYFVKGKIPSL
jgi:hypothetical protein